MKLANDYRIRIIGTLTIAALRLGLMSVAIVKEHVPWWVIFETIVIFSAVLWESSRAVVFYFHRRYPLGYLSGWRFLLEAMYVLAADTVVYALHALMYMLLSYEENRPMVFLAQYGLIYTFLYGSLIAAFYEFILYMNAWQKANREAEQLKKVNLMVQLDSLKNQVKPHFLFNSLNTLTALVEKDQQQAVKFIAELSKVYRYLLQSNEKELISLDSELQFTQAYFFLLQTRFGAGLSMTVDVCDRYTNCLIPPLTLQLLIENAVKHNQVSVRKPLQIQIYVDDDRWLVVQNTIQVKRIAVATNGMGLTNITTKYKLLAQDDVIILNEPDYFTVKVPLIHPSSSRV
jgi:sensor histidine kinase YesM